MFYCAILTLILLPCVHISTFWAVGLGSVALFGLIWISFWFSHQGDYFFFDPQDCVEANPENRAFPIAASTATFEPLLAHYIGVTKLMVTVAAASIAFGGDKAQQPLGSLIVIAKLILAWSILYGVFFCILLIWRYDEYSQNVKSYTRVWYSTVIASGFGSFLCFIAGYIVWGWGLMR